MAKTKLPVHETETGNELAECMKTIVPPIEKGVWSSYRLDTSNYSVSARWDDNCENVIIRIRITP